MNFYLCFVKTRSKIDKYFKINKIKKKVIIDVSKIIEEEYIDITNTNSLRVMKLIIYNKIKTAREKKKDVYYLPNFNNNNIKVTNLLSYKDNLLDLDTDTFNLLCFYNEFTGTVWLNDIMDSLDVFNNSQILKDY